MTTTPDQTSSTKQSALGNYIAQADRGGTAMVVVYQAAAPAPVDEITLARAEALLAEMPLDAVPPPAGLPTGSWLPLRRNALFVGREPDLQALASTLKTGGRAAVGQSAAVTGLGGIGKTQLACEFAYRYGRYFQGGVFWLGCADPVAVPAEIAACGVGLNLHADFTGLPLDGQVALVAGAWHGELPRLLVFDNCEDEAVLETWVPRGGGCRVLVTARRGTWPVDLGVKAMALGILTRSESIALLRKHHQDIAADDSVLDAIATELGDHPLALHLAGAYMARYRYVPLGQPVAYLKAVQRPDLLEHRSLQVEGRSPTGHEQHVARTFALSWDRLDPENDMDALARAVLARAAWFAPGEPIPRDLLQLSAGLDFQDDAATTRFEDAVVRLSELGLIGEREDGGVVLHRLLHAFVRGTADGKSEAARAAAEEAIGRAADYFNEQADPRPLLAWQAHLRAVAEAADHDGRPGAADLVNQLGLHLLQLADVIGARAAFERARKLFEETLGPDDPTLGVLHGNLGEALRAQGDFAGARTAAERALAIQEKALNPDHPDVARAVNNLGGVLHAQGDFAGAKAAFERALPIWEAALGPDHPNVALAVNNLGEVLRAQGDLAGAKTAFERALAIQEKALNPDHPDVARAVNNLGGVLHAQGDFAGAKAAFERALAIQEAALGPDHPDVARAVNNLGLVLHAQGDLAGAKAAFERALPIWEAALGPDHPDVALAVNNLGLVLHAQGDLAGARVALERALAIFRNRLGEQHPHTDRARRALEALDADTEGHGAGADSP